MLMVWFRQKTIKIMFWLKVSGSATTNMTEICPGISCLKITSFQLPIATVCSNMWSPVQKVWWFRVLQMLKHHLEHLELAVLTKNCPCIYQALLSRVPG